MRGNATAKISFIASMVVFGTIGAFVKGVALSSAEIALWRAVMAVALIGAYLLLTRQKIPFRKMKKELVLLIVSGMAMAFNWIFLFEAYKNTTVSVATLSYYFAPVIVTVVCPLLFKERLGKLGWICSLVSFVGLVMVVGVGEITGEGHALGIIFGLLAAVLYAAVIILNKLIRGVVGIHRTFLQFVSAVAVLLPYVLLSGGIKATILSTEGIILLITVGILHTGIAYCVYFSSLTKMPGQESAILSYIDPLVAVIVSVALLGELITPWQIVGGALILGGALVNEICRKE